MVGEDMQPEVPPLSGLAPGETGETLDVSDALRDAYWGVGLIFVRLGRWWILALEVALVAGSVAAAYLLQATAPSIALLLGAVAVSIWARLSIEDWLEEHNARVRSARRLRSEELERLARE
jgi:hypothetical protein